MQFHLTLTLIAFTTQAKRWIITGKLNNVKILKSKLFPQQNSENIEWMVFCNKTRKARLFGTFSLSFCMTYVSITYRCHLRILVSNETDRRENFPASFNFHNLPTPEVKKLRTICQFKLKKKIFPSGSVWGKAMIKWWNHHGNSLQVMALIYTG